MLKRGTREYISIHCTLNSNRFYPNMDDESKAQYAQFIQEVFSDRLPELLVYRKWVDGERHPYIQAGDDDPAFPAGPDDIIYLESSISHEIGNKYQRLHSEIYISVCAEKMEDYGLVLYHNMVRALYEKRFGQKCSLKFQRFPDKALGQKLYALKQREEMERIAPEMASVAENKVHFFRRNIYKK